MLKRIFISSWLFLLLFVGFGNAEQAATSTESNRIRIGMTRSEVVAAWGEPRRVIKKNGKEFDEVWIYKPNWKFKNYLYFKNDILIKGDPNPENLR